MELLYPRDSKTNLIAPVKQELNEDASPTIAETLSPNRKNHMQRRFKYDEIAVTSTTP